MELPEPRDNRPGASARTVELSASTGQGHVDHLASHECLEASAQDWQRNIGEGERAAVSCAIAALLLERKPDAAQVWLDRVGGNVEDRLFTSATSLVGGHERHGRFAV